MYNLKVVAMKSFYYSLIAVVLFFNACSPSRQLNSSPINSELQASSIVPVGRYVINEKGQLALISSAVHFGFSFEGNECRLNVNLPYKEAHNYIQYELDGVYKERVRIEGDTINSIVIRAPKGGTHKVWIYKATEAHTGDILVNSISGSHIKPLIIPAAPLIEFIGNSITCGAAADPSLVPCGSGSYHDQHNAYFAYGPRVARMLNANFIVSGVSGIGIYRTWNNGGPAMPELYEKVDFQNNNQKLWDFNKYQPAIVSIALGTNDLSKGDGIKPRLPFDSTNFVNNYIDFVRTVKSKYPFAQMALLSSPMLSGDSRNQLQNCLMAVKSIIDGEYPSAKPVALHFFKPMNPKGCSWHPDVEDHGVLAGELVGFYKNFLEIQ